MNDIFIDGDWVEYNKRTGECMEVLDTGISHPGAVMVLCRGECGTRWYSANNLRAL